MHRVFSVVVILALSLAAPVRPHAALDPDGLRRDVVEGLAVWFAAFGADRPAYDEVAAAAEGDGVRVRIVALSIPFSDMAARLHVGDVSFLVRDGGPGRYRVSDLRTRPVATFRDAQGQAVGEVAYSIDRFSGLWSGALLNFLDLDAAVSDVKVVLGEGAMGLGLERLTLESRTREGGGLSDMESRAQGSGLRVLFPNAGTLRIDSLHAESETKGQDLAAYRSLMEEFRALGATNPEPDPQELAAALDRLARLDIWPRSFIERLRLTGVSASGADDRVSFRLREVEFDAAGQDLRREAARGSLGARFSGVDLPGGASGVPPSLAPFVPSQGGFITSVENLPLDALWRMLLRGLAAAAARGEGAMAADGLDPALQAELVTALRGAGATLRLDRLDLDAPGGRLIASGVLEASATAPTGATARFDAEILGLDQMIAATVGAAGNGGAGAQAGQAAAFLFLLKSMARRETAEDGRPVDRFTVEMTGDGQLLVNGQPFSALVPKEQ